MGNFEPQAGLQSQRVEHLNPEPEVPSLTPGPATYFCFSFNDSRWAVVSYWQTYVHLVLLNHL